MRDKKGSIGWFVGEELFGDQSASKKIDGGSNVLLYSFPHSLSPAPPT